MLSKGIFLLFMLQRVVFAIFEDVEECQYSGEYCADHAQCCGGCCFYGECINTYRSCLSTLDVCKDHACIGSESCVVYVPPQCSGCEPVPMCRDLSEEVYFTRK